MDQYIGKMLDNRYEILELIGTGGMANVYKAKCHRLNRMVAVKILKSDLADSAEFRRRFRDESQAVAQLSHANIMSVYDVSRKGEVEYIVMELIEGITLKQYMERRGQMDWREALHFISQIMRGLSHAHGRGIIHRDIKPQNIMILRDGSVKVADFGIACLADTSQTLTQEAMGSVHYISPEQARGDRMDARSDIYSAGVVLYEMLTGRLPFEGDSAVSVAIQHLSSVPLNPREINPDVPEALELICMKAMNPNVAKRYVSADAMLEDLEKFRKDPSADLAYVRADLQEKQDTQPTQPIAAAEVAAAAKAVREQKAAEAEAEERKRSRKIIAILIGAFAALLLLIFAIFKVAAGFGAPKEPDAYVVPHLLGKTLEQAEQMPEIKGIFTIEVIGTKVNPSYQPGQIIEQTPDAGVSRKNNLIISVYVCVEEEAKTMPSLAGTDYQVAKVQLTNMGLDLEFQKKEEFSDKYPEGQVIKTEPALGEALKKGNTVLLVVSKGPEKKAFSIPGFVGKSIDDAALEAESMGLKVMDHVFRFSSEPAGTVLEQSLAIGTEVKEGDEIVFTVSQGPEVVNYVYEYTVPDHYIGIVQVEFRQDNDILGSIEVNVDETRTNSYTFSGVKGTTATIRIYVNGTQEIAEVITF